MPTNRLEYREKLKIDEDDLDACLVEQAELFLHVAEALVEANAARDTLKLQLEEVTAELDRDIRARAAAADEKITEAGIQNQLRTLPRIRDLRQDFVEAGAECERWGALKDSYRERSFMLRELNASQIARLHNLSLERGAAGARHRIGEQARAEGEAQRAEQRRSGQTRYRGGRESE